MSSHTICCVRQRPVKGVTFVWEIIETKLSEKEMSQYQLAKKMNIHSSILSELKFGRIKKPSFELVCKIADALEIKVDELRE